MFVMPPGASDPNLATQLLSLSGRHSVRLQNDLDAMVLFLLEDLIAVRRVRQRHSMGNDETWIDLPFGNVVQ